MQSYRHTSGQSVLQTCRQWGIVFLLAVVAIGHSALADMVSGEKAKPALNSASTASSTLASLTSQREAENIALYRGLPLGQWQVFIENYEVQQALSGASAVLPKGDVKVQTSDKEGQNDALTFAWKDAWRAGLTLESGEPLDVTRHMQTGVLTLDIKIDELAKGGVSFKMACQKEGCDRVVPFTMAARNLIGKGWQKILVPLSCFKQAQDDFSATTMPFALEVGGAGEVAVANVQLLIQTPKDVTLASCPDYKTVSLTPGMLNEWWAIDWWLPRHTQKLADAKTIRESGGKIDLLFIGDSITQGWEKEGAPVWKKRYANRNAFASGFGGDRTENVLWRFQHGALENMSPKLVVMMIGTNNTGHRHENPVTTAAGIKRLLDELQQQLPHAKVLLLAVFPRDEKPDGELRQINNGVNAIIKDYADNNRIFFADINSVFLTKKGVLSKTIMPDSLHPNKKGYELWAKALEPHLRRLLK